MHIFLFLGFLLLSLSDGSLMRSQINKRPRKETNINDDIIEVEVPFSKRPKVDPNAKVKIFILPREILAFVGTFLQNPFETLAPVSHEFRMAMKCFSPNYLLQSRTNLENFDQIPVSPELARLLKFDPVYLNSKANHLLFPGSVFRPESPVTVAHALYVIETRLFSQVDKLKASHKLVEHLINFKQYESILVILRSVPNLNIRFTSSIFFTDLLVYIYESKNFVDFHVIMNSCRDKLPFFFTLASLPVSLDIFKDLIKDFSCNNEMFLSAFAASCAIILPFSLTEEEEIRIKERNLNLISTLQNVPEILVKFVLVCNDLRYSTSVNINSYICNEFFIELYQYAASADVNYKARIKYYNETLAVISLMRGYKNIFKQLVTSRKVSLNSDEFVNLLIKSPEFLKLISPSQFKKHLGIKNQVLLFEAGKLDKEEVKNIKNIYERIRVMSCFMEPEEFKKEVQVLFSTFEFSISSLIENVIKLSEEKNVAKIVHLILQSFIGRNLGQQEISKLSVSLGNSKYLKSILTSENQEFLLLPSDQIYILINNKNFKEILKFSTVLKQEKAKDFRERFLVKWISVFRDIRLFPHEIEKFFDIFNIKIGNFNYSNEYALSTDLILKDSRALFKEPEILGPFVDFLLIEISEKIFVEDQFLNYWHSLDKKNPFVLKAYGIYKLWSDKNLLSFLSYARNSLLICFNSNVTEKFINSILLEDEVDTNLVSRVLLNAISSDQHVEIKLKTVEELRNFFHENVPKIIKTLRAKDNYNVNIDWIAIIEGSRTVIDYEIILSVITQAELMNLLQLLTKTENILEFFGYLMKTYHNRYFTETNRHLVK